MNKYPMEESLLLFGLMEGCGAQMPKKYIDYLKQNYLVEVRLC